MKRRPRDGAAGQDPEAALDAGFWLVLVLAGVCLVLVAVTLLGGGAGPGPAGTPGIAGGPSNPSASGSSTAADVSAFLLPASRPAPALALTGPDDQPVSLAGMRGTAVFVFFGYTHCPDICPATIGIVGTAMRTFGAGVRAVFVTIDPERDTTTWLREYVQYLSSDFTVLTGSATQIRSTADAWDVRYAKVETSVPGAYSMSHTADVFLVDAAGMLRAKFPFGTNAASMAATLRQVSATAGSIASASAPASPPATVPTTPGSGSPAAASVTPPAGTEGDSGLRVEVVSSSVWAGGTAPVILALYGPAGRLDDLSTTPAVQLEGTDGSAVGPPVTAVAVQPPGIQDVSYVASLSIPSPGWWRIAVSVRPGALTLGGSIDVAALDQGASAPIGGPAPTVHNPTLDDVGGDVAQLTTDPIPDLRLYRRSTTDALAEHVPFVFVLDSTKFRVTTACGKAIIMARYLQDRWPNVTFIHHEPYRYTVVTDTPVLDGSLGDPPLTDVALAWGIGGDPWGAASMPWVFIVDGNGIVRAKYQGILGSDDVDVIVALIAQGG